MKLEKVYDELYGMIEDLKKKVAAMSGGDKVTITPTLESGEKIADYSIGSDEGTLYAPKPVGYSTDEQDTGMTWIDGSPIYQKTINAGAVDGTTKRASVPHSISNIAAVVDMKAVAIDSTNHTYLMLSYANTDVSIQGNAYADNTNVNTWINLSGATGFTTYVTLYYTKVTTTETKNRRKK